MKRRVIGWHFQPCLSLPGCLPSDRDLYFWDTLWRSLYRTWTWICLLCLSLEIYLYLFYLYVARLPEKTVLMGLIYHHQWAKQKKGGHEQI